MELKPCLRTRQVKRKESTCCLPGIFLLSDAGTTATVSAPSQQGGAAAASEVGLEGHAGADVMPLWNQGADATLSEFPNNFMPFDSDAQDPCAWHTGDAATMMKVKAGHMPAHQALGLCCLGRFLPVTPLDPEGPGDGAAAKARTFLRKPGWGSTCAGPPCQVTGPHVAVAKPGSRAHISRPRGLGEEGPVEGEL